MTSTVAAERTFTFAVDGTAYEIDLSSENIAEFKSAIGGFIESARKVNPTSNGRRQRGTSTTDLRERHGRLSEVREWARKTVTGCQAVVASARRCWLRSRTRARRPRQWSDRN